MSIRASVWGAVRRCILTALVAACAGRAPEEPPPAGGLGTTVLLISIDGFRWHYLDRGLTPNLSRLAREGVRAEAVVPVFPTTPFPITTRSSPAGTRPGTGSWAMYSRRPTSAAA
jgi:hypothetical protein